jgi:hypothetical protein
MAIKTIYQCDKCGNDQDSKEGFQLFEVSVGCNAVFPTRVSTKTECLPKKLFCRDCMNGSALLGITDRMLEERRLAEMTPPVAVTLEDMIREIAEEAGAESAAQAISNR